MPSFVEQIASAQTRWDAAVVLLNTWNSRPPGVGPVRTDDEFLEIVDVTRAHFDAQPHLLDLTDADRSLILRLTDAAADLKAVDAVGFGLNFAASAVFAHCWRDRLGTDTHRLQPGEVFPVADAPWEPELGASRRTPSPRSMSIEANDHPYARTYRAGMVAVEFDFRLWRPLRRLGLNLDLIAAVTVNEDLGELGLAEPRPVAFPVEPEDPDRQKSAVLDQLERALGAGAEIVVFPELSTSRQISAAIEGRLADDTDQRLVICGSWHETEAGTPANLSVGLVSGHPHRLRHRKIVEFGDLYPKDPDKRMREGIAPPDQPVLNIYVADRFRFALVICKDFLDSSITRALDHVGANVLLVPSLSRTTQPFKSLAGAHITRAQAVSVLANGPRLWNNGAPVVPTSVLARPYEPDEIIESQAQRVPSTSLFSLRDGVAQEL